MGDVVGPRQDLGLRTVDQALVLALAQHPDLLAEHPGAALVSDADAVQGPAAMWSRWPPANCGADTEVPQQGRQLDREAATDGVSGNLGGAGPLDDHRPVSCEIASKANRNQAARRP